jgi:hypothetical protein
LIVPTQIGFEVAEAVTTGASVTDIVTWSETEVQPPEVHGVKSSVMSPVEEGVKTGFIAFASEKEPDPETIVHV